MNDPVTRTGADRWPSDVGPRTGTATGKAEFRWRRPTDSKDVTRSGRRGSGKAADRHQPVDAVHHHAAASGPESDTTGPPNRNRIWDIAFRFPDFPFPENGSGVSKKRKTIFQKWKSAFRTSGPADPADRTNQGHRKEKRMGFKAFPHRLIVRIGDEAYRKLRQESRKAGYQVALVERWFLIPQDVGDLYSGIAAKEELHDMMHPELPDGTLAGRRSGETYHDIFLTDAEYEVVILAAVKRGLTQGAYAARILREQIAIAENLDWPIPEDLTNKTVDDEARRMLRKLKTGQ